MIQEHQDLRQLVATLFKNDKGNPFILTDGQLDIFEAIFKRKQKRIHISASTRYGKSEVISMAVLLRVSTYPEKWAIAAGNKDKAGVIMNYVIKHIFDNKYTRAKFLIEKGENEENIRRYRNKSKINFNVGNGLLGEIFIITAENALGFGAENVVEDESALINNKDHTLVLRMLGDQVDNFLCKVGNPWDEEHFRKSFEDPTYRKIIIDYKQGVTEGRYTPEYIEEMRKQPYFDVLYECKFPKSGTIDEKGWVQLLSRDEIEKAMIENGQGFGPKTLGVDVAGGGRNFSVIVQRQINYASIKFRKSTPDTMEVAELVINLQKSEKILPPNIGIDTIGIGKGVCDIVNREIQGIRAVNVASEPPETEKEKFVNLRSFCFWKAREWIVGGGKIEKNDCWYELTKLKYRTKLEGTKGKMQIISKEELAKEGILSPDVADALALTFAFETMPELTKEEWRDLEKKEEGPFDRYAVFGEI